MAVTSFVRPHRKRNSLFSWGKHIKREFLKDFKIDLSLIYFGSVCDVYCMYTLKAAL